MTPGSPSDRPGVLIARVKVCVDYAEQEDDIRLTIWIWIACFSLCRRASLVNPCRRIEEAFNVLKSSDTAHPATEAMMDAQIIVASATQADSRRCQVRCAEVSDVALLRIAGGWGPRVVGTCRAVGCVSGRNGTRRSRWIPDSDSSKRAWLQVFGRAGCWEWKWVAVRRGQTD